ncbi:MAG: DUF1015 family protein [Thermoplasmata archaeon]|nr:DUF1015 domain-containing protein [Thermoplasmata archaeon]
MDVRPFKGISYSIKNIENLVTEPYDKISKQMQKEYYEKSPYNFIRINLPNEIDPYTSSKKTIESWLKEKILTKDKELYFYFYIQQFRLFEKEYERFGFFAAVKLEDYSEKKILPHERTFKGPKEDRLKMLRSTNMDLEPVFFLYDDPAMEIKKIFEDSNKELEFDITVNGIRHVLYKVKSDYITKFFNDKQLVIADGHHRYETALAYAKEKNFENGTGYIMAVLVNRLDPGLVILPSHRVLKITIDNDEFIEQVKNFFDVKVLDIKNIKNSINDDIVYVNQNKAYSLNLKKEYLSNKLSENINVSYLNNYIFNRILNIQDREKIIFERWVEDALNDIKDGSGIAFILKAVNPSVVWDVARNGEIMPEKSTDFYPKLLSGLKMMDLNEKIF